VGGTLTMSALTASTALALNASKQAVSVTNTGTGNNVLSASPTLTGTIDAAAQTLSGNLTLNGGTANGVLYLNGSKVATSGTALVFDGTNLTAPSLITSEDTNGLITVGRFSSGFSYSLIRPSVNSTGFEFRTHGGNSLYVITQATTNHVWYTGATGGTESMRLNSTGLGIGTSSPATLLDLGTSTGQKISVYRSTTIRYGFGIETDTMRYYVPTGASNAVHSFGQISTTDGTTYTERMRLDSSGNLGLGITPAVWNSTYDAIQIGSAGLITSRAVGSGIDNLQIGVNWYRDTGGTFRYAGSGAGSDYTQTSGAHQWFTAASGTAGNAISFTQAMTLDASGNLGIGTTSPSGRLDIRASGAVQQYIISTSATSQENVIVSLANNGAIYSSMNFDSADYKFKTSGTERARITSGGELLVGKTSVGFTAGVSVEGIGVVNSSRDGGPSGYFNRNTNDGAIVIFVQDGTEEGSISVSGNTISYNAFAGSHWSQLQDGSKPDILRGTVMESINELCVWPDEQNERLPKSKVSDTAGSKKVYGVFMAWDNDWATTNDMYVTAVGAFICRVNASVTVQEGDLLESNGDGTARVQADDIIRSSTIGKVTSTVKTHQYDDGSYCVPTVLYCG
jgi:hypothetical protein